MYQGRVIEVVRSHKSVVSREEADYAVNFDESECVRNGSARRGFLYKASGVHYQDPDTMPVIRNKRGLTLPLRLGQRVECKDGVVRTVERFEDGGVVTVYDDGIVTYTDTADCDIIGGGAERYNAVCDA